MKNAKWLFAGVAAFIAVFGGGNLAIGQQSAIDLPVNQATSYKGEEFLLIGDANRGAGEPVIAINPNDPNNILVGAMASSNYVEGEPIPTGFKDLNWKAVVTYANTRDATKALFAVTYDRGRTWHPLRIHFATIPR